MKEDRFLLTFLIAIYLLVLAVVLAGAGWQALLEIAKSGINQEWLGFTGAIIGGLITAGAGCAAWVAAQLTIKSSQAVAERREQGTFLVVQNELVPKAELFVRYWRVIQRASSAREEIKRNGETLIRAINEHGISDGWLDEMRRLGSDLNPMKRRQLIDVLRGVQLVRDQISRKTDDDADDGRSAHFYLLNLRTMLSHFERYLKAFDPEMAKRFDRFTKSAIDHREMAEHIDPLIETFEQTGNVN